jgi:type IV pilus assembly protein PilV
MKDYRSIKYNKGFTLLEALIAFVIISVGLLGMAGLQVVSLKENQMAFFRTQASILAYDMADRIRANAVIVDVNAGKYAIDYGDNATAANCVSSTCNSETMADYDLTEWTSALGNLLPAGGGSIVVDASGSPVIYTITVYWDQNRTGANGTGCDPDVATDMKCFQVEVTL